MPLTVCPPFTGAAGPLNAPCSLASVGCCTDGPAPRAPFTNSAPQGKGGSGGSHTTHSHPPPAGGGGGASQGNRLFAFGGVYWPLALAHPDPLWVRTWGGRSARQTPFHDALTCHALSCSPTGTPLQPQNKETQQIRRTFRQNPETQQFGRTSRRIRPPQWRGCLLGGRGRG